MKVISLATWKVISLSIFGGSKIDLQSGQMTNSLVAKLIVLILLLAAVQMRLKKKKNVAKLINFKKQKSGQTNNSPAYMYMCVYIYYSLQATLRARRLFWASLGRGAGETARGYTHLKMGPPRKLRAEAANTTHGKNATKTNKKPNALPTSAQNKASEAKKHPKNAETEGRAAKTGGKRRRQKNEKQNARGGGVCDLLTWSADPDRNKKRDKEIYREKKRKNKTGQNEQRRQPIAPWASCQDLGKLRPHSFFRLRFFGAAEGSGGHGRLGGYNARGAVPCPTLTELAQPWQKNKTMGEGHDRGFAPTYIPTT